MRVLIAVAVFSIAASASAQLRPHPGDGDPHLQTVDYVDGQVVQLRGALGYQLMVELSPDEQVQNVAIGDSAAWQVSLNKAGDRLFLKPIRAEGNTNMTVVTSVRVYAFDLLADSGGSLDTPYTVQFRYPSTQVAPNADYVDVSAIARRLSVYRISGDRLLRPISVSDDGQRTYVSWSKGAPIPAIYVSDNSGNERLVNGMMGVDDVYVIDGVPQLLKFRIDDNVARAERINPRKAR
jgi:type IV secretion system protein VirB9